MVRCLSALAGLWQAALALGMALLLATPVAKAATLIASYNFDEAAYSGAAGELKDSAGYGGGPFNGSAIGKPLPTPANASPARSDGPGTCGYASLPGPTSNGGAFTISGLPVDTRAGAKTSVAFWMYWNGVQGVMPIGWQTHDLWLVAGGFGFNTGNSDVYGVPDTGLANTWRHVVAVFTNGSVANNKLYIDGVDRGALGYRLASSSNLFAAMVGSTLRVGGWRNDTGYRMAGKIDQLRIYNGELTANEVRTVYAETPGCAGTAPHHLEIQHTSGSGLTCSPSSVVVKACADANCSAPYAGGVSGTLNATGGSVVWPDGASFSIAAGSSSSSSTVRLQATTTSAAVLGVASSMPSTSNAASCNFGSPSCTFSAADSGLLFGVPHHASEVSQSVTVSAVKKSDSSLACIPAFASVSRSVSFSCIYTNPSTGNLPVRVGGTALNAAANSTAACDAGGRAVTLAFNANGVASTTVQYADAGQVLLQAVYAGAASSGETGLVMRGSSSFIAAPATFGFSAVSAGPIRAGTAFSATVSARNNAGSTTPNFGRESTPASVLLGFSRYQPSGAGARDGDFSGTLGAFSQGRASASNLAWTEVGSIDLRATLAGGSYLGSGLGASGITGSTGAVGRFIPHHFDLATSAACGNFSHAGQPFTVSVTARNASNQTTRNYDGSAATSPAHAKATTLADAGALGLGSWSGQAIAASAFTAGVASASPAYTFTTKTTAPQNLTLRASDSDGVSSAGFAEPAMPLRSGRLRLANAYGSAAAALQLAVVSEYWSGNSWLLNGDDSCSALAGASVVLSNPRNAAGNASTATSSAGAMAISNGAGSITLAAPKPAGSSLALDVALNLGTTATDQSCQTNHPASTGAGLRWLRAQNGSCAATADRDPAARASFGIFAPETRRTVHVRDIF